MSKRTSPIHVNLADFKAKKQIEGAMVITDENGVEHHIDAPALWSDDLISAAQADADPITQGKLLLGDDGYAAWVAGGGTAISLQLIIAENAGMALGE